MTKTTISNSKLNDLVSRLQTLKNIQKKRTLLRDEEIYKNTLINEIEIQKSKGAKVTKTALKKPVAKVVKNSKELFINGVMIKNSAGKVVVQKGTLAYVEYQNMVRVQLKAKEQKEKAKALKEAVK